MKESDSPLLTQVAVAVAIIGGHMFLFMLTAMIKGFAVAAVFFTLLGLIEVIVWKRKAVAKWIAEALEDSRRHREELERARVQAWENQGAERPSTAQPPSPSSPATVRRDKLTHRPASPNDSQVELVLGPSPKSERVRMPEVIPPRLTAAFAPGSDRRLPPLLRLQSESIPTPKPARNWHGILGGLHTLNRAGAVLPEEGVEFYGPQSTIQLDRGKITGSLVYATAKAQHGSFDASLIDGSLPIAPPAIGATESLPYWPTYHDASPNQRSRYLDWLIGGRIDPKIELGYVFIYFYGLERRILIDNADHEVVAQEVLRLRQIYSHSRSFQRYSASLIWLIVALAGKDSLLKREVLEQILADTHQWDEDSLGQCLAYLHDSGSKLGADWAYLVAKQDHRVQNSVIVQRHETLFRDLFAKRFAQQFPDGLELKASRKTRALAYRPASSTLLHSLGSEAAARIADLPNVLGIASQFKPLVAIWEACVEELRIYDRAHRAAGELSAKSYEALPQDLQSGDHPDYDKWFGVWQQSVNADGIPVVPIPKLAELKDIPERRTLLKTQCSDILRTATCLGIGVEPDFRLIGRNYRWDETVTLFLIEGQDDVDAATYLAASSLLQLGMIVAAADGRVDAEEVRRITEHLGDQFNLTPNQARRLEAHRLLLQHTKPDPNKLLSALKKRLTQEQRSVVGEYLLGVAAADQIVTAEEKHCLKRIFTALDLPESKLEQLIQPVVTGRPVGPTPAGTDGAEEDSFYLDQHAISRIMRDTEAVAAILKNAMAEAEDDRDDRGSSAESPVLPAAPIPQPTAVEGAGLAVAAPPTANDEAAAPPARFRAFFEAIILRPEWSEDEAKQLARRHQVMLAGAVEALNEWSQERWNDWLIEEGDPLRVRLDLLERKPL